MAAWVKMVLAVGVVLIPGGFLVLLGFAAYRTLRQGWQEAARLNGGDVRVKDVLASVHFRDIVREARAAF